MAGRSELFGHEMPRRVGRTERPSEAAPPPATRGDDPETAEQLRERLEALAIEKGRLERRLADLTRQFGDQSSRAAALHYRLWSTNEDRRVLELNLAGERSAAHTWQSIADELRAEVDHLKARLAKYEPRPEDAA